MQACNNYRKFATIKNNPDKQGLFLPTKNKKIMTSIFDRSYLS